MSDFDPTTLDWDTGILAGWKYDKPVNKWFQGAFRSTHRLTRSCPTCRGVIVLDVTARALRGEAVNHGLALRRCRECRTALKQSSVSKEYDNRKAIGNERRAAEPEEVLELERIRKQLAEREEAPEASDVIESLRMQNDMLTRSVLVVQAENAQLKARLAKYELQPAMAAKAAAFDPHALLAAEISAKNKMPWQ